VRLIVARCEVAYTGRLNAYLPEATRLLMLKADGSVLVHADAGGYKPLNCGFSAAHPKRIELRAFSARFAPRDRGP
jgi:RecB family endonuclease NucS